MDALVDGSGSRLAHLSGFTGTRPSTKERLQAGRRIRKSVPRSTHAQYRPSADRPDPVSILEDENRSRLSDLVPLRYARMLSSPFAFFRGSAAIMARDLESTPSTGLEVMACGDMHVANFGVFGTAERNLIFAINDFDEVHPGPWQWDLKRLITSAVIVADFIGGRKADGEAAALAVTRSYQKHIRRYASMGYLKIWYEQIDQRCILGIGSSNYRRDARAAIRKARSNGVIRSLDKLTRPAGDSHRFIERPPSIVRETHMPDGTPAIAALDAMLRDYMRSLPEERRAILARYRIVDAVRKVVGVGSIGTRCYALLLQGVDAEDVLFLQVKEAQPSVVPVQAGTRMPFRNQGKRVVVGQRMIQGSPDIFLGWGGGQQNNFYVRQLADMKGGARFLDPTPDALLGLESYCELCGWALALAHAKSGDPALIAGYYGSGDALNEALVKFAFAYMKQTNADFAALQKARKEGRIKVAS